MIGVMDMQQKKSSIIKVLSYNTLIQKYTYTSTVKNDPNWRNYSWRSRLQQLILKMVSQSPDVICLQQIRHVSKSEGPNYYDFYNPLHQMGFEGVFSRRNMDGQFGQQGLAIFFNKNNLHLVQTDALYFNDNTGRNILAVTLRSKQGCIFRVATTHIIYPSIIQKTQKQIQLVSSYPYIKQNNIPCVLTGDFNLCSSIKSHSKILSELYTVFQDAHEAVKCKKSTFSLNLQGSNCLGMIPQVMGTKIDYIFVSKNIKTLQADIIGDIKDLPTMTQPSDHLPIFSSLRIPHLYTPIKENIKRMKHIFQGVTVRKCAQDIQYQQFLKLFWQMPRSIQNAIYQLTYHKAVELGIYEYNLQFGRAAFTNNANHNQTFFDEQGNLKTISIYPVTNQLIPKQQISKILNITQQRISIIPQLIKELENIEFQQFLQIFDEKLSIELCNKIYGETYRISNQKGLPTHHLDYGRVSFRNIGGWNIQNNIRIKAMQKMKLP